MAAFDIHPVQPFSLTVPCALAALSSISGRSWVDLAAGLERHGTSYANGMQWEDVEATLMRLGYLVEDVPIDGSITFGTWRRRHDAGDHSVYLICLTGHAIVVQADRACGIGLALSPLQEGSPYDRRRVVGVSRIHSGGRTGWRDPMCT